MLLSDETLVSEKSKNLNSLKCQIRAKHFNLMIINEKIHLKQAAGGT